MKQILFCLIVLYAREVMCEWALRSGLTAIDFQRESDSFKAQNFTLTKLCGYTVDSRNELYVAHWEKNTIRGPIEYFPKLSNTEFEQKIDQYLKTNDLDRYEYSLISVCPFVLSNQPYFSAVWEKKPTNFYKVSVSASFMKYFSGLIFSKLNQNKFRATYINSYVENNQELSISVLEENNQIDDWQYQIKMSEAEYLQRSSYWESKGYRPNILNTFNINETLFYAATWEKINLFSPGDLRVRYNINQVEFNNEIDYLRAQNFHPRFICAFAHNQQARYNIISVKDQVETNSIKEIDDFALQELRKVGVIGMNLAISKNERLVFNRAYGLIGSTFNDPLSKDNSLKIASISKLFTSVGIFKLIEQGRIKSLKDKVFGPGSILGNALFYPDYNQKNMERVTLVSLLQHLSGFRSNNYFEPTDYEAARNPEITIKDLLQQYYNERGLFGADPEANRFQYSNIGYITLGFIIEHVSGKPYEQFIRENVLIPCDIGSSMYIKNSIKQNREPFYVPQQSDTSEQLLSTGGFAATAQDLVKLLVRIDQQPNKPDIINSTSLDIMRANTTFSFNFYGTGMRLWPETNSYGHDGSLTIIGSIAKVYRNGITYAMIVTPEPRSEDQEAFYGSIEKVIDRLDERNSWPNVDLFDPLDASYSTTSSNKFTTSTSNKSIIHNSLIWFSVILFFLKNRIFSD